jgi:hypothetical protein
VVLTVNGRNHAQHVPAAEHARRVQPRRQADPHRGEGHHDPKLSDVGGSAQHVNEINNAASEESSSYSLCSNFRRATEKKLLVSVAAQGGNESDRE